MRAGLRRWRAATRRARWRAAVRSVVRTVRAEEAHHGMRLRDVARRHRLELELRVSRRRTRAAALHS